VGHPDISDLFLDPQEQQLSRSPLKYGKDLGRDGDSRNAERGISGGLLTVNETSNSVVETKDHLQPPYPVSDDTHVSMDDLFG
jgi:hypothetical protein